ncbi:ThuA domain-containing protein [Marinimicrobium sp. ARAG 43.8]|uniref:ThuA domain-containing protein n=1 Tax=Marinimicrobium sp. ARAG 43.8 TaxID=3418719 RepID=UPI003CE6DCC5
MLYTARHSRLFNRTHRLSTLLIVLLISACSTMTPPSDTSNPGADKPARLHILLITGGGWHDYDAQTPLLVDGLNARIPDIEWTVWHRGEGQPDHTIDELREPDWADDYDLVIHNTGFGRVDDSEYVSKLVAGQGGTPAVLLHSSIHSYRYAMPAAREWFAFTGAQSMWHEHEREFAIDLVAPEHSIMQGFPAHWAPPLTDELYVIEEVWGEIVPLAVAHGVETGMEHPVVWTHEPNGTRVFATTLGHNAAMFEQEVYLNMVANGVRWAVNDDRTQ